MPRTYTAVAGDTLESVSLLFYGSDSNAELIKVASGVTELQPGQILLIP